MKYFLGGVAGLRKDMVPAVAAFVEFRLLSMHQTFKSNTKTWCDVSHHKDCAIREVMLDSGAFTAFVRGQKVTMEHLTAAYDEVLRKINKRVKVWMINLDVIPGEKSRVATPSEISAALDESDKNYKVLKKRYGSRVLPVYHQTEGAERLKEVCAMNDYIGAGFRQDFAESDRVKYAQDVLLYARSKGTKVHGLATTGYKMLARAPFNSVDSATWLYIAAMGGIMVINDRGELDNIAVSSSSPKQRDLRQHFNSLSAAEQALIKKRVQDAGATLEQVQGDLSYRILVNANQMREWLTHCYKPPKRIETEGGLFPL